MIVAAAFLADPLLGWTATAAVVAHEVAQEAGDFALLLASGRGRQRALFWNGVSSLTDIAGGIIGYFLLDYAQGLVPLALTLAAAGFIYIAVADLLPRLRGEQEGIPLHVSTTLTVQKSSASPLSVA
ncbi:MAG: ZIP family metal transporter [Rhodocyclales bacterium]|nr:ZIP family metal transporter [Rhodocyclales bacterium]